MGSTADKSGSAHGFFPKPLFRFCTSFLLHSTGIYWANGNIFGQSEIPPTNGRTEKTHVQIALDLRSRSERDPPQEILSDFF